MSMEMALEAVKDLAGRPGVSVIKHTNPWLCDGGLS